MAFTPKDAQTQNDGIVADNEIRQGNTPINDDDFDDAFGVGYENLAPETTPAPKSAEPAPRPTEPTKPNVPVPNKPTEPVVPKEDPKPVGHDTVPNAPKPHAQKPEKAKVVETTNNFVPVKATAKQQLYEAKVLKSPTSFGDPTRHASKHAKITKKMLLQDVKRVKADAKKFKAAKTRKKRLAAKKKLIKDKKKLLKDMKKYSKQHKQDQRIKNALKPGKSKRVNGAGKAATDSKTAAGFDAKSPATEGLGPNMTLAELKQEGQAAADTSNRKTQEDAAWLESSANPMNRYALENHSLKETAERQANTKSILSPIAGAPQVDGAEANMQLGQ